MKCIYCGSMDSKVVDSRQNEDGTSIRRRRECVVCGKRFTTYETVESTPIMVVKKDGSRQAFDLNKIKIGIITVPAEQAQGVCDLLISNGILAIWNFAPKHLNVPDHILVQNENMAASLALLCKHLNEQMKAEE